MNEERERAVAADVRSRVIADCAALLPLARSASFRVFRGLSVRAGERWRGQSPPAPCPRPPEKRSSSPTPRNQVGLQPDAQPTNRRIRGKSYKPKVRQHAQGQIQQKQKQNINLSHPQRWPVPFTSPSLW